MDCGHIKDLDWASVSFGVLMCDRCAYEHLEQGVDSVSFYFFYFVYVYFYFVDNPIYKE